MFYHPSTFATFFKDSYLRTGNALLSCSVDQSDRRLSDNVFPFFVIDSPYPGCLKGKH